jgi:hypothetical protein
MHQCIPGQMHRYRRGKMCAIRNQKLAQLDELEPQANRAAARAPAPGGGHKPTVTWCPAGGWWFQKEEAFEPATQKLKLEKVRMRCCCNLLLLCAATGAATAGRHRRRDAEHLRLPCRPVPRGEGLRPVGILPVGPHPDGGGVRRPRPGPRRESSQ